ncbi:unnamed protein product [Amaranthus hypochondriacus]
MIRWWQELGLWKVRFKSSSISSQGK